MENQGIENQFYLYEGGIVLVEPPELDRTGWNPQTNRVIDSLDKAYLIKNPNLVARAS